ncbi:MAG: glycosyltransferase [Actinomycetota bacterium]|nr:glycosyltransferase [Actinomycetota bacterium]
MLRTVDVPARRLDDYAADAGDDAVERLRSVAAPLRGARILQVNSTAFGGGVAELLVSHVPLLRDLGIDAEWAVLDGSDDFFHVTKAVHNGLQGMAVQWTPEMEDVYWERVRANAANLEATGWDHLFIHDPQPAGLLPVLEEESRRAGCWTWRCHIDVSRPHPPVWAFFEPMVNRYDDAVFTMETFAQPGISGPRLAIVAPSIDPTTEKNRPVDPSTVEEVLRRYHVDPDRPLAVQVSRFDPWKDPLGVIDAYRLAREEVPGLQLVMAGSMAADDPEGIEYLTQTRVHAGPDPDIHLLTDAEGVLAHEVNAFQHGADVVIQKSTREGFGLVVTEAMWKRRSVIGGRVGGITLQIEDGVSGFLVDSVDSCAARLVELIGNPALRDGMGHAARERVRAQFLSLRELEDYLTIFRQAAGIDPRRD